MKRREFLTANAAAAAACGLAPALERPLAAEPPAPPYTLESLAPTADAWRGDFLFPRSVTYGNTGTLGASPRAVVDTVRAALARLEAELPDWPYFQPDGEPLTGYQELAAVRGRLAELLGVGLDEIALTQNATLGMNALGNGIDWRAGDVVLTTDQEHGGAVSIFRLMAKRRGIALKELPLGPAAARGREAIVELFQNAASAGARAIMVSHVTSQLGIRMPVEELVALARDCGALSLIDGAQALGQLRVDVRALGCDAYVASPHKWLLAPKGTGILFVRREAQRQLWTTLASYQWENFDKGAFRFGQHGTGSPALVDGLVAALDYMEPKLAMVEAWDLALAQRLRDGLARIPRAVLASPADPRLASAITTFRVEGVTARDLQNALWQRRIRVRAQGDDKGVRLSAHLYVGPQDIDAVLEVVRSLATA